MDFVREDPSRDVSLDVLSRVANASPFHFHRIFKAVSGEPVAAFVRRARLERAAYLMQSSPVRRLTSIALDVGFTTMSEFSRGFRREYGIAPSQWDRRSRLQRHEAVCSSAAQAIGPEHPLAARVVHHKPCHVAFVRMRTVFNVADLQVGFQRLTRWLAAEGVDWRREQMMGMSWDNYHTTPLDRVHYDLAFTVPESAEGSDDIGVRQFPALTAVEVHCHGSLNVIAGAWDYLYDSWFPTSHYMPAHFPPMKRFRRRPDEIGWDLWDLDCSIAIVPGVP